VSSSTKGKWAAGIPPRYFTWVIRDRLAISERPGGYARTHRPVRRQEEIIWLKVQGFTAVVSLLVSPHNLHAYDQQQLPWLHRPLGASTDPGPYLEELFGDLDHMLAEGGRVLLHQEELGDRLMGVAAAYLCWSARVPSGPQAIAAMEQLSRRQIGAGGRAVVAAVEPLLSRSRPTRS